ncbi:GDSL esterase/lipase At5g55050-like isoform X2 [Humulus lupulus]|uniref:GDSL esterase/lipase At5g55050-like isoform X2 n=1 Tax=Humulus lupulus TaxID=3486 RepID=UPI002B414B0D|nr:GDSL esterase/lipase At5g55050-like isoform X2 [Humulus lupulus]
MANDNIILVVIIVFFFCFCQFTTTSFSLAYPLVPAIYTFGDSLVDVGNNNYLLFSLVKANFPHNGIDFPTKKPTGRFCNGKNAVDLLGVNFASGGSGILNQTNQKNSLSLTKQVNSFIKVHKALNKQLGPSGLNQHISKSLFVIVTGSNDIFSYFGSAELRNKTTPSQYINSMVATFKGQVERLYNLGALRFVIVGIGVIGCTPSQRKSNKAEQCNEEVNSVAIKYNEALTSTLKSLKVEQKELNYSYFDGYSVMQNAIQKPATYGLFEIKAACCGLGKLKADVYCLPVSTVCSNRSSHLFWDASHPTETAHRIFVDYIFGGPLRFTFPLNVKQLIGT